MTRRPPCGPRSPPSRWDGSREAGLLDSLLELAGLRPAPEPAADDGPRRAPIDAMDAESLISMALDDLVGDDDAL